MKGFEGAAPRPEKRPEGERPILTARLPHHQEQVLSSLPADFVDVDVATAAIKRTTAWANLWKAGREVLNSNDSRRISKSEADRKWQIATRLLKGGGQ